MLSAVLCLQAPVSACGYWEPDPGSYYVFYSPQLYSFDNLQAFHFTYDRLYDYSLLEPQVSVDANVVDWQAHLGKETKTEEINNLIYTSQSEDFRALIDYVKGLNPAPYPQRTWALTSQLKTQNRLAELEYLLLCKDIEPMVAYRDEWEDAPEMNVFEVKNLVEASFKGQANATDNFLKMRYGYQGVRLLHRAGMYKECADAWEKHMKPLKGDGLIWWWSMADYAGALRRTNRAGEAAYYFSKVFDNCPSRRIQSWYGWEISEENAWQEALNLCQNSHEKAVMHFLRCAMPDAIPMQDLQEMHKLEPNSPYVQLTVVREINKLEDAILGYKLRHQQPFYLGFTPDEYNYIQDPQGNLAELKRFVASANTHQHEDRDFWVLTKAYLEFLSGDFSSAKRELDLCLPTLKPAYAAKGAAVKIALQICSTQKADAQSERELLASVESVRGQMDDLMNERLSNLLDEGLSLLYKNQGEYCKSILAIDEAYRLYDKGTLAQVEEMIAFVNRAKRSPYEEKLQARLGEEAILRLKELRGTRLLGEDRMEEAIAEFLTLPEAYRKKSETFQLEDDPFRGQLQDIINCDEKDCSPGDYDKLSFAQRILELRKRTVTDKKNMAAIQMQLGHAYYNTSFFGPAWRAMDYTRRDSWYSYNYYDEEGAQPEKDIDEIRDRKSMEMAAQYYGFAAANSSDKEMAAEALFHLAKADQNMGYMDQKAWFEQERPAFDRLIKEYKGTNFFRRRVKECKYFNFYVSR